MQENVIFRFTCTLGWLHHPDRGSWVKGEKEGQNSRILKNNTFIVFPAEK